MTDLERRAMLGDAEAQRECTEKGIVLPCWRCGGEANVYQTSAFGRPLYAVSCKTHYCGAYGCAHRTEKEAILYWNTRPAPPTGRCGECKHSTNPAALTMIYGEPGTLTCHHGPCNRRNVNENDFCSYFEPKGGEENASD